MGMSYKLDCRYFTGYKPCQFKRPCYGCPHYDRPSQRIAILHTEALGAVLRSTCLLEPLRRKYPGAHITWITYPGAKALLQGNPLIDRIITIDATTTALIRHLEFDLLFAVDKSLEAGAFAEQLSAREKFGFGLSKQGAIRPFNSEAVYQYDVGLDDELKFRINEKPETQQTTESMNLKWERDPYVLELTPAEKTEVARRRQGVQQDSRGVIGFNTGCSVLYPYKKFTVKRCTEVVAMWRQAFPDFSVAILGGKEDAERNLEIKSAFSKDNRVVLTPTDGGLRSGVLWVDTADLVLSGCSLGMHIAIGLKKHVVAWFGVSCAQEVDLYDRGIKLQAAVGCSPCWLKNCDKEPKCYEQVAVGEIERATKEMLVARKLL